LSGVEKNFVWAEEVDFCQDVKKNWGSHTPTPRHECPWTLNSRNAKIDAGRTRTCAPEGTSFLGLRDNHSATAPEIVADVV
jgi:hypothetical protein